MTLEIWSYTTLSCPDTVWDELNRQRAQFLLLIDREMPAGLKLSRRSRRRWRGRGGVWAYDPEIRELGEKAGLL